MFYWRTARVQTNYNKLQMAVCSYHHICTVQCFLSVNVRDDAPAHNLAVLVPVLAVFLVARVAVAQVSVYQQDAEVDGVEVRYDVVEPCVV
jgi:hypothetical protein